MWKDSGGGYRPLTTSGWRRNSDEDYQEARRHFAADPTMENYAQLLVMARRYGHPDPLLSDVPSYTTNDPLGWGGDSSRGAAMGRPSIQGDPGAVIILRETMLDSGGYDRNGTYFGGGPALFWYADVEGNVDDCIRARRGQEIEDIRDELTERYPYSIIVIGEPIFPQCTGLGQPEGGCPYGKNDITDYSDYCEGCGADEDSYCATCECPCTEVGVLMEEDGSCASCSEAEVDDD